MAELDYLDHIRRESTRFATCLAAADPGAKVPTCPDWTSADLLWHLTEVQLFWTAIVAERLQDPGAFEEPDRPAAVADLLSMFGRATDELIDALDSTPSDAAVWTWADDKTAGFVERRQAHEALIHRLDAEYVIDDITTVDPALAADGVDEALVVMFGGVPAWGSFDPDGADGRVETDDGSAWPLRFGRFTGTSPDSGTDYDEDAFVVERGPVGGEVEFVVHGAAENLDRWLWSRGGADGLAIAGDRAVFDRLAAMVSTGID